MANRQQRTFAGIPVVVRWEVNGLVHTQILILSLTATSDHIL